MKTIRKQKIRNLKKQGVPFDIRVRLAKTHTLNVYDIVDIFKQAGFIVVDKKLDAVFYDEDYEYYTEGYITLKRKNTTIKLVVFQDLVEKYIRL